MAAVYDNMMMFLNDCLLFDSYWLYVY